MNPKSGWQKKKIDMTPSIIMIFFKVKQAKSQGTYQHTYLSQTTSLWQKPENPIQTILRMKFHSVSNIRTHFLKAAFIFSLLLELNPSSAD